VTLVDCRASAIELPQANLRHVTFEACKLDDANFRLAKFEHVRFDGSVLVGAELTGARLDDLAFDGSDLAGADFSKRGAPRSTCAAPGPTVCAAWPRLPERRSVSTSCSVSRPHSRRRSGCT
jgi:hypothetical protein